MCTWNHDTLRNTARKITGRALQVVGSIVYIGSVCTLGYLMMQRPSGVQNPMLSSSERALHHVISLLPEALTVYFALKAGYWVCLKGKKIVMKAHALNLNISVLQEKETIVLYLRSFLDDQQTAKTPVAFNLGINTEVLSLSTEEENLARSVKEIGSLLAISLRGSPVEVGALRLEAQEKDWKEKVVGLMIQAKLVILRAGFTPSLCWEIEQAIKVVPPERLVFLIPQGAEYVKFTKFVEVAIGREIPAFDEPRDSPASVAAALYFDREGNPFIAPLATAGDFENYWEPLRARLRMAIRPIYDQLGYRWTPPPVPFTAIARGFAAVGMSCFGFFAFYVNEERMGCLPFLIPIVILSICIARRPWSIARAILSARWRDRSKLQPGDSRDIRIV